MTSIALVYNTKHETSYDLLLTLVDYIRQQGASVFPCGDRPGFVVTELEQHSFVGCDAAVVLGGDGTMLSVARAVAPYGIPLFGINMGRVGFLSAVERSDAFQAIDDLLCGNYTIEERLLLNAQLNRDGQTVKTCTAFNDIVVSGGDMFRAVPLDLYIDEEKINSYNADGIIVSTPTGSTGYSLSAGGPIVMSALDVMVITPVCPHTFFSRPIIASANSKVMITNQYDSNMVTLTADGQIWLKLVYKDEIIISQDRDRVRLIHFGGDSYFDRIKRKLYV